MDQCIKQSSESCADDSEAKNNPKTVLPDQNLLIISLSRHPWHGAIGQSIFLMYILFIKQHSWFFKSLWGLLCFGCRRLVNVDTKVTKVSLVSNVQKSVPSLRILIESLTVFFCFCFCFLLIYFSWQYSANHFVMSLRYCFNESQPHSAKSFVGSAISDWFVWKRYPEVSESLTWRWIWCRHALCEIYVYWW